MPFLFQVPTQLYSYYNLIQCKLSFWYTYITQIAEFISLLADPKYTLLIIWCNSLE